MLAGEKIRKLSLGLFSFGTITGLCGCLHRQAPPTLPPLIVELVEPPLQSVEPAMEGALPNGITNARPVKVTEARPRHLPRKTSSKTTPAEEPTEATDPAPPDTSTIGELSSGGDSNAKTQQDASELIAASDKRLAALPSTTISQQQSQLRRVRYFLRQAKQALSTGDAEGAKTLATKARLLLDDLAK
jgi:hypothetical protein